MLARASAQALGQASSGGGGAGSLDDMSSFERQKQQAPHMSMAQRAFEESDPVRRGLNEHILTYAHESHGYAFALAAQAAAFEKVVMCDEFDSAFQELVGFVAKAYPSLKQS